MIQRTPPTSSFPTRTLLAMQVMLYITCYTSPTQPLHASAIEANMNLPPRKLETILRQLINASLLSSNVGAGGGYYVDPSTDVTLGDIYRATHKPKPASHPTSPLAALLASPLAHAGDAHIAALEQYSLQQLARQAQQQKILHTEYCTNYTI